MNIKKVWDSKQNSLYLMTEFPYYFFEYERSGDKFYQLLGVNSEWVNLPNLEIEDKLISNFHNIAYSSKNFYQLIGAVD